MDAVPLPPGQFAPGDGPFGARGILVSGFVEFARRKVAGGLSAVLDRLDPPTRAFFDGALFLASGVYDLSPVISFVTAVAAIEGKTLAEVTRGGGRASARISIQSLYARQLAATDAVEMASRLPKIFGRFFEPCHAEGLEAAAGRMRVRFMGLPQPMLGFYAWSCEGFVPEALRLAGAIDVAHTWSRPAPAGEQSGIDLVDLEFRLSWA